MSHVMGLRIKRLRERRGLGVRELSKRVQVSPATISKLEKGQRKPSIDLAMRLADVLGVSLDYLMGMYSEDHEREEVEAAVAS